MYTMMAETGGSGSTRTTVICDKKQWHWQEAEPNVSQSLSSSTRPLRHCCRFTSARGRQRYPSHSWISFMLFFISFVTMTQAQSPSTYCTIHTSDCGPIPYHTYPFRCGQSISQSRHLIASLYFMFSHSFCLPVYHSVAASDNTSSTINHQQQHHFMIRRSLSHSGATTTS